MTVLWKNVTITGITAALAGMALPAAAQTVHHEPVQQASLHASALTGAAAKSAPNRWLCASSSNLEIAEVSSDVASQKSAWVVVYRRDGHAVASERIDAASAAAINGYDCGKAQAPDKSPLVG